MRGHIQEYRNNRFRVIWYFKGDRFGDRFDTTQDDRGMPLDSHRRAERFLEYINQLIDSNRFDPCAWKKDAPYLFEKAAALWIELSHVSNETLQARKRITNKFLIPYFKGTDIREIRRIDLDGFLSELEAQGRSPKYCYNIMGELKACLNFHYESIPKIPRFPKIEFQEYVPRLLGSKDQDHVFEFIPEAYADKHIFTFLRYTMCRPNEARGLLKVNVHRDHEDPYLVLATVLDSKGNLIRNTKTKRTKHLPIIPEIEEALKPRDLSKFVFTRNGLPYSKRMLQRIWNKANRAAHEKYGTPIAPMYEGLRHSGGTQRVEDGFPLADVQEVMGHTSIKTTKRYVKYQTNRLAAVMRGKVTTLHKPYTGANGTERSANESDSL